MVAGLAGWLGIGFCGGGDGGGMGGGGGFGLWFGLGWKEARESKQQPRCLSFRGDANEWTGQGHKCPSADSPGRRKRPVRGICAVGVLPWAHVDGCDGRVGGVHGQLPRGTDQVVVCPGCLLAGACP